MQRGNICRCQLEDVEVFASHEFTRSRLKPVAGARVGLGLGFRD